MYPQQNETVQSQEMDTESLILRFLEELKYKRRSKSTLHAYKDHLNHFYNWTEENEIDITKLTFPEAKAFRNYLCQIGLAPASINAAMAALKGFYTFLSEEEVVKESPIALKKLCLPKTELQPDYLDDKEVASLLSYIEKNIPAHISLAFRTMLNTGLRVSEAASLKPEDVIFLQGKVFLKVRNGKGNKKRTVPVMDTSLATELINKAKEGGESLFSVQTQTLRTYAFRVRKETGIDFHTHRLRHTAATAMLAKGIPIDVVQVVLGHSSISITRRYATTLPESLFKIAADISET